MSNQLLDQWSSGTKPSDSSFSKHPLGDYRGVITSIKASHIPSTGCPVWNITVKTQHGTGQYTIWGFTQQDMQKAQTTQEGRDMVIGALSRTKRIYVDLGVWSEDEAIAAGWSSGTFSILGCMNKLMGKPCTLHVEVSTKDPNKQVMYINAPISEDIPAQSSNQGHSTQPPSQHGNYPQANGPQSMGPQELNVPFSESLGMPPSFSGQMPPPYGQ